MKSQGRTSRIVLIAIGAFLTPILLGFGILFYILQQRAHLPPLDPRVRHKVTAEMLSGTERKATLPAPEFSLPASDDQTHTLAALRAKGPVLINFVNVDCPCSKDAQPMYNAFARAYPDLTVVGVVNAKPEDAWKWGREQRAGHLMLADPSCRTMRAYGAVSSVYTALVTPRGRIVKIWPGYSQAMMAEVSLKIADLIGVQVKNMDPALAPKEMAAGCAFPPEEPS
jgi:peroxiredoxin